MLVDRFMVFPWPRHMSAGTDVDLSEQRTRRMRVVAHGGRSSGKISSGTVSIVHEAIAPGYYLPPDNRIINGPATVSNRCNSDSRRTLQIITQGQPQNPRAGS